MCQIVSRLTRMQKDTKKFAVIRNVLQVFSNSELKDFRRFTTIASNEVSVTFCVKIGGLYLNCLFVINSMGFRFAFAFSSRRYYMGGKEGKEMN